MACSQSDVEHVPLSLNWRHSDRGGTHLGVQSDIEYMNVLSRRKNISLQPSVLELYGDGGSMLGAVSLLLLVAVSGGHECC